MLNGFFILELCLGVVQNEQEGSREGGRDNHLVHGRPVHVKKVSQTKDSALIDNHLALSCSVNVNE